MKSMLAVGVLALASLVVACGGEEACVDDCGDGCPSPEAWPCASDGERYCNSCVIDCYDLEVVDDSMCD